MFHDEEELAGYPTRVTKASKNRLLLGVLIGVGAVAVLGVAAAVGAICALTLGGSSSTNVELEKAVRDIQMATLQMRKQLKSTSTDDSTVYKWNAPYLLPRYYQRDRGTCWVHLITGLFALLNRTSLLLDFWSSPTEENGCKQGDT